MLRRIGRNATLGIVLAAAVVVGGALAAVGDTWEGQATMGTDGRLIYSTEGINNAHGIHAYTSRTLSMTLLDDATQAHYTLTATGGRLITDPAIEPDVSMYVYNSGHVTLSDANGTTVCRAGNITAGGDWRAVSYAELSWPRRCRIMASPQYLNFYLGGGGPHSVKFNQR